jgi:hypothetical protein
MADKVAYVKQQKQDRNHTCHWPSCKTQVPPAMWGCKKHWFRIPKALRDEIWMEYAIGQEMRMDPNAEYLEIAQRVQDWIWNNNCVESENHHVMPHRSCILR